MLRRAVPEDAGALAALHRRARQHAMPWLPVLHTPEQDLRYFTEVVLAQQRVWMAVLHVPVGFAAVDDGSLEHLYVEPTAQRRGTGRALLEAAQRDGASRLRVFARNAGARRFYEAAGWRLSATGGDNEEGLPDCTYVRQA